MSKIDDGGSAFPHSVAIGGSGDVYGSDYFGGSMSLRDYFAAAALTGSLAFPIPGQEKIPERCAEYCYQYADAMLKARKEVQS